MTLLVVHEIFCFILYLIPVEELQIVSELVAKLVQRSHFLLQVKKPGLISDRGGELALSLEGAISSFRFLVLLKAGIMEPFGKISLGTVESEIRW